MKKRSYAWLTGGFVRALEVATPDGRQLILQNLQRQLAEGVVWRDEATDPHTRDVAAESVTARRGRLDEATTLVGELAV